MHLGFKRYDFWARNIFALLAVVIGIMAALEFRGQKMEFVPYVLLLLSVLSGVMVLYISYMMPRDPPRRLS